MKWQKITLLSVVAAAMFAGCTYKTESTPAVMSYDGSKVDYTTIDSMKHAKVCKFLDAPEGDVTIVTAAKAAGIKYVKHVDHSVEFDTFLFWDSGHRNCVTVYGE